MRTREDLDISYEVEGIRYSYVDVGSSKEVYRTTEDDSIIIKIPRAINDTYGLNGNSIEVFKPTNLDQVDEVLSSISEQSEGMVWPIGQLLVEIFVWEKLLELEAEGYDIDCFARLTDYYFDQSGIPVIEQEAVEVRCPNDEEWKRFSNHFDEISAVLESRWDIHLHDVRRGNVGFLNGQPKLYDFGMINFLFDSYSDYDTYEEDCDYYDYDEEEC